METDHVAKAATVIAAPLSAVWEALVTPKLIKQYLFGADVVSEWREGAPIAWKGQWNGKPYEDKGTILRFEPDRLLRYSHFSPLSGAPDRPESYHTVHIELQNAGPGTRVELTQDNNPTEEARAHSQRNWEMMLANLKDLLEGRARPA
jgi:uncharacterized protein YndB with AHSA1/START domain